MSVLARDCLQHGMHLSTNRDAAGEVRIRECSSNVLKSSKYPAIAGPMQPSSPRDVSNGFSKALRSRSGFCPSVVRKSRHSAERIWNGKWRLKTPPGSKIGVSLCPVPARILQIGHCCSEPNVTGGVLHEGRSELDCHQRIVHFSESMRKRAPFPQCHCSHLLRRALECSLHIGHRAASLQTAQFNTARTQ